jgi:hypothetical protein
MPQCQWQGSGLARSAKVQVVLVLSTGAAWVVPSVGSGRMFFALPSFRVPGLAAWCEPQPVNQNTVVVERRSVAGSSGGSGWCLGRQLNFTTEG